MKDKKQKNVYEFTPEEKEQLKKRIKGLRIMLIILVVLILAYVGLSIYNNSTEKSGTEVSVEGILWQI